MKINGGSLYIIKVLLLQFFAFLTFFIFVQKPVFIIYNSLKGREISITRFFQIIYHGFSIDLATASYFSIIPLIILCMVASSANRRFITYLKVYLGIASVILSLACIADTVLYDFWMFKLDATVFMYINDPKNAVASVSILFVVGCIVAVAVLSFMLYRWLIIPSRCIEIPYKKGRHLLIFVVFLLCGCVIFGMIRGLQIWPKTPARVYFSKDNFLNHAALNPVYNLIYSLSKMDKFDEEFQEFTEKERRAGLTGLFPESGKTEKLLNTPRPNILLIVLEGMGACFVESLNGKNPEVAPNISRLSKEGVNFTQCYCSSFRTDRGIVSVLSGYPGQPTTSIMRFSHKIKSLPGLPKSLKAIGYDTQILYSGDMSFFNMFEYFNEMGHDKLVSEDDFPNEQQTADWGVHDEFAFNWLLEDIENRQNNGAKPWYITMLTISSHGPFDVPYKKLEDEKLNAFAYTDSCFGDFIDKLRCIPAWDNLLVVATADHGYNLSPIDAPDFPHIPLFMIGGAINEPRVIDRIMNQTDIAATLLAQVGTSYEDFYFSRDVMSDKYTYPFSFSTYNNGFNFRDSVGVTVFDNTSQRFRHGDNKEHVRIGKVLLQTIYKDLSER